MLRVTYTHSFGYKEIKEEESLEYFIQLIIRNTKLEEKIKILPNILTILLVDYIERHQEEGVDILTDLFDLHGFNELTITKEQ